MRENLVELTVVYVFFAGRVIQKQRLQSDDELSLISAAPSSPNSAYTWEESRFSNHIRHSFPPPLPPFLAGVPAFPMLPPAHFYPPHMPAAGMPPVHPPAFLPGIPPPHRNVAFVTPVPQSYSQPHFMRPRFDATLPQAMGGTYHKHKPWITDEILEMIAVRDRLYKRMKKHPSTDIVDMYKKVRTRVVVFNLWQFHVSESYAIGDSTSYPTDQVPHFDGYFPQSSGLMGAATLHEID